MPWKPCWSAGLYESTTPWCGRSIPATNGGKRFQTRLRRVWNRFIPHESQVSIYRNQGVGDSLFRPPITSVFLHKNTTVPAYRHLSPCPHPNKEVARDCTCPYDDAKDGYLWCKIMYAIHQDFSPTNIKNASNTIVQVLIHDILVKWILCRMHLYAHKYRLHARDK